MPAVKIGASRQVVIPKRIYDQLGLTPGDYLEAFRMFVSTNLNKLPALLVVTQRPKDLTRDDLRQLRGRPHGGRRPPGLVPLPADRHCRDRAGDAGPGARR